MPRTAGPESPRVAVIDTLRGVAIGLVLLRHVGLVPVASRVGWIGVDLFFVLSGYLVSGLLFSEWLRTGSVDLRRFLLRRGFKIWPQFYAMVAVSVLICAWVREPVSLGRLLTEVVFLQNYLPGLWSHTWSLAVEEHFYLTLAGVWFLARRFGRGSVRNVPVWIGVAMAGVLGARIVTACLSSQQTELARIWPTHLRADALLMGVLLAHLRHFHADALQAWVQRRASMLSPASVLCLAPAYLFDPLNPWMHTVGFTLNAIGFGLLLLLAIHNPARGKDSGRAERLLSSLGRISYGTYLWQGPALFTLDRAAHWFGAQGSTASTFLLPLLGLASSVFLGWLTTRMIEQPFLQLRRRLVLN